MESGGWRIALVGFLISSLLVEIVEAADNQKDDENNEFAFNIFTDIAPILALFGEQFARQFMSESFTWLDHVIFAMVPLGIVAGITSAIRVQGPHIVRAFIGRARENKALVEYELMSSTSHEVGEAFNGQGIVRVMGRPKVTEFVIFPKQYDDAEEFYKDWDPEAPTNIKSKDANTTGTEEDDSGEGSDDGSSLDFTESSNDDDNDGHTPPIYRDTSNPDYDDDVHEDADDTALGFEGNNLYAKHRFCGIHSLESITQANDPDLMQYGEYHSQGYSVLQFCRRTIQKWFMSFAVLVEHASKRSIREGIRNRKKKPDPETAETPSGGEEDEKKEVDPITKSGRRVTEPALGDFLLGPPNLQLNLTPDHADHRRHNQRTIELYAVAMVAVLLQTGLVALAAATVYYEPFKVRIPYDSQSYGFPCYVVGTSLLCLGMGICSYAVERNSVEVEWTTGIMKDASSLPRLLFLQQEHSVNDQYFEAYTLLSGRKCRILGSARNPNSYSTKLVNTTWEWITVAGAVASGAGFTCQFMGLRGLTYPCSLAQLGAVILMVILRGFIRRGLGRESAHSPMLSGCELEHLAILVTYLPEFRSFNEPERENRTGSKAEPLSDVFDWQVVLPRSRGQGLTIEKSTRDADTSNTKHDDNTQVSTNPRLYVPSPSSFQPASSEQLLRVRKRLGNLCQWKSRSAEHALILTQSIEHFMDIFFPLGGGDVLPSVKTWDIPVLGPAGEDKITFVIGPEEKNSKRKWRIDIGKIEAVISLWMAFMEARMQPSMARSRSQKSNIASGKNESDWLRDEDGEKRLKFYRLLGESARMDRIKLAVPDDKDHDDDSGGNDSDSDDSASVVTDSEGSDQPAPLLSALERDIKWWVGDQFTLISRPTQAYHRDGQGLAEFDPWMLQGPHHVEIPELAIGFNMGSNKTDSANSEEGVHKLPLNQETGKNDTPQGSTHELGVISEGFLADILIQHLFTSFIWAISKSLPEDCLKVGFQTGNQDIEIESRDQFDHTQFDRTWYLPRLSHTKLREAVRQIESYGLGNKVDVLLCIIPALSERDLLPNHAMLSLIPPAGAKNDWASIARCYYSLMMSTLEIRKPEKLCYAATVHVMDFLELACQPYSKALMPSEYLLVEIRKIVRALRLSHFLRVLQGIVAALHNRQGRGAAFESIIRLYGGESNEWLQLLDLYREGDTSIVNNDLKKAVGYSSGHQKVFDQLSGENVSSPDPSHKEMTEQDMFGWTPLHYYSASPEDMRQKAQYLLWEHCRKSPLIKAHHHPDRLGRTPLHIAAARGFDLALLWMTSRLAPSEKRSVLVSQGQDGMTLLHLAVLSQDKKCLSFVIREGNEVQRPITDVWGREPIHIASQTGNVKCVKEILGLTAWTLSKDLMGKTPVDYAIATDEQQDSDQGPRDHTTESNETDSPTTTSGVSRHEILLELARIRPRWRDDNGKGFIHHTAEMGDPVTMSKLVEDISMAGDTDMPDQDGKTPLHYAISAGKTDTALELLQKFGVDPLVEDKDKTTPLMLAAINALTDVAKAIVKSCSKEELNKRNRSGASAVHFIIQSEGADESDSGKRLEMLKILKEAGCNILQEDDRHETILHLALSAKVEPIWAYLLSLPRDELRAINRTGDSLLIQACRGGCTAAVSLFLELWPEMVRDVDANWGRSPLSWACVEGHEAIVRILAANGETDLNYSPDSLGLTPLHLAVERESSDILACLLDQDSSRYDLSITDNFKRTPLTVAIQGKHVQTARMLLNHSLTSDSDKVRHLRDFLDNDDKVAARFHGIIVAIFGDIPDTALTSEDLLQFIDRARILRLWEALDSFVQRAMKSNVWLGMKQPYHVGIETNNAKLIADAVDKRLDFQDEDGWSLQNYAASRDRAHLLSNLDLSSISEPAPDAEKGPESLVWGTLRLYRKLSPCRAHGKRICSGIQAIHCKESAYGSAACVPTNHCVPHSSRGGYFYFEVSIRTSSPSRLLALGFCSDAREVNGMPGSLHESWGFYGNSGHLLARGAPIGEEESLDLGYLGSFGAGDIVGVGWSSVTGEALCTKNGERLLLGDEMQTAIKNRMLKTGKKYACIGNDLSEQGIGLQFRVNLGLSPDHPFIYEGPFN